MHVFDFLEKHGAKTPPVLALYGGEAFLKRLALLRIRESLGVEELLEHSVEGASAEWRDMRDELSTVSLFGGGKPRLVVVDDADKFVTAHRSQLESYAAAPKRTGVLVLQVDQFLSTTKLFKAVDKLGGAIHCGTPEKKSGRRKVEDTKRVIDWLVAWADSQHHIKLPKKAASLLTELRGLDFGLLDQELAKLALFVEPGGKVEADLVQEVTGGWKSKTIWELLDAALDGNSAAALEQLDRLITAGEAPIALFGQLSWSLRRFAAATHIYERGLRQGSRLPVHQALSAAGFKDWPQGALGRAEGQLKRLGRRRGAKLYTWLLDLDLALKGSHSTPARARWALEQLVLRLSAASSMVAT